MFTTWNIPSLFEVGALSRCAPVGAKDSAKTFLIICRGNAVLTYALFPHNMCDESFHLMFTSVLEVVGFCIITNLKDDFDSILQNHTVGVCVCVLILR